MTHRATIVLSLCLGLVTPLGASAQSSDPVPVQAPAADAPGAEAPVADAPADAPAPEAPVAEVPAEAPAVAAPSEAAPVEVAPVEGTPAPAAPVEAGPFAPPAPVAQEPAAPAEPPAPEPAPVSTPAPSAELKLSEASGSVAASTAPVTKKQPQVADEARCAQLFAQGQTALAQAEGCSGGEQPIYAGSQFAFSQIAAPASRTLPDNDNAFYALNLYVAPRFRLTEKWALFTDVTLGYEVTTPDDTIRRHEVQATDTRIAVSGMLGSVGGVTFLAAPRIILPTSKASWAVNTYLGAGTSLGAVKNFDVLSGLALQLTGVYTHVFSGRLTPKIRADEPPACSVANTDALSDCPAGGVRAVQDRFAVAPTLSLSFSDQWSTTLSYAYSWGLVKPFSDDVADSVEIDTAAGPTTIDDVNDNALDDTRWRRTGSLSLSVSYQPASWLIATLSGNTSVCYAISSGIQSSLGGCSGGLKTADAALRNPIANKYSTVSLALTVPVDALIQAVTTKGNEQKTAKAKAKAKL